ncbi:hypothetical protein A2635_01785 [Candidatus Peribacteria bacterium RIFCSPHIGHO2_01_FULL_51_9]|nr:MAG: hypothetical protein A2635_01785 [Candidatus Peribacteria bacterium RIFCSPHIGHO2_01_FULL_51_9]
MPTYTAFLGHQPHISLSELAAIVPGFKALSLPHKHILNFESSTPLTQENLNHWGGIVVLSEHLPLPDSLKSLSFFDPKSRLLQKNALTPLSDAIINFLGESLKVRKRGKVIFSLRTEGLPPEYLKKLYRICKEHLRRQGRPSRYIGNERKPAIPVLLHDSKIIDSKEGCELTIIMDSTQGTPDVHIGLTVGAQDSIAYTRRDMEKPARDTRIGLLPPKLAQVMLNLGQWAVESKQQKEGGDTKKKKQFTVFDPFCGTGVIPMECLLKGWNVFASDASLKAVHATEKNIEWLRKEYKIFKKDSASDVWKHDATKPFDTQSRPALLEELDVIVTETSLGPAFSDRPTIAEVGKLKTANEKLQASFLENVAHVLPGIPIVCTWPIWYTRSGPVFLEKAWKSVEKYGFTPILPTPLHAQESPRPSLIYRRPDQCVGREIVILKPVQ